MRVVRLGNPTPIHHATGALVAVDAEQVTEAHIPDGWSTADAVTAITHRSESTQGVWATHSADEAPSWVWSDDAELAQALAAVYGCPVAGTDDDGHPVIDTREEGQK